MAEASLQLNVLFTSQTLTYVGSVSSRWCTQVEADEAASPSAAKPRNQRDMKKIIAVPSALCLVPCECAFCRVQATGAAPTEEYRARVLPLHVRAY
jgi:hypothetical protein